MKARSWIRPSRRNNASRPVRRPGRSAPVVLCLFAMLFVATGLTGGVCNLTPTGGTTGGSSSSGQDATTGGPRLLSDDHILGSDDAEILVFMYGDFNSADCGRFIRSEFPTIKTNYIDTNKIRWVYRHNPSGTTAEAASAASECAAAQDTSIFFSYHDLLYDNQDDLTTDRYKDHASTLGLNATTFDACISGSSTDTRVNQDVRSATALGVSTTPTFFVNNEKVSGFKTAADLSATIDRHLAE